MMDWQVKVATDIYNERVQESLRNYEIQQAVKANRAESNTGVSEISTLIGGLLVGLGKRLERWGTTLTNSPQARDQVASIKAGR